MQEIFIFNGDKILSVKTVVTDLFINDGKKSEMDVVWKKKERLCFKFGSPSHQGSVSRKIVSRLVHESLMAGHMSNSRTVSKVLSEFF